MLTLSRCKIKIKIRLTLLLWNLLYFGAVFQGFASQIQHCLHILLLLGIRNVAARFRNYNKYSVKLPCMYKTMNNLCLEMLMELGVITAFSFYQWSWVCSHLTGNSPMGICHRDEEGQRILMKTCRIMQLLKYSTSVSWFKPTSNQTPQRLY